jgi:hypothetical protein
VESSSEPYCEAEGAANNPLEIGLFNDLSEVEPSSSELWVDGQTHGDEMGLEFMEWYKNPSRVDKHQIGPILGSGDDHPLLKNVSTLEVKFLDISQEHIGFKSRGGRESSQLSRSSAKTEAGAETRVSGLVIRI